MTSQEFEVPYFEELSDPTPSLVSAGTEYPPNAPEGLATAVQTHGETPLVPTESETPAMLFAKSRTVAAPEPFYRGPMLVK